MKKNILIIEDSQSLSRTYQGYLAHSGYIAEVANTGASALQRLTSYVPDLILLDLGLPDIDGLEILESLRTGFANIPVVVITANASLQVAVRAMRAGALDYLVKPFDRTRLVATLESSLERSSLRRVVETKSEQVLSGHPADLVGNDRVMQAIYRTIDAVSSSDASVFITGETGTGKELAARGVHDRSKRSQNAFHAINCGAIPSELMESELFGHVKGAFTGATTDRDGAATVAAGGTLFLDELGEMPMLLQTKLLRFIQLGVYQKVGESRTRTADIRFICAMNKSPMDAIKNGTLREDLYYRLNVVPIMMPPLRERGNDVILIAERFLGEFSGQEGKHFTTIAEDVKAIFRDYAWPGNVRQLENVIRNVVVLQNGDALTSEMLPKGLMPSLVDAMDEPETVSGQKGNQILSLEMIERRAIENALEIAGGNIQRAAQLLKIDASTIHRRRRAWASGG